MKKVIIVTLAASFSSILTSSPCCSGGNCCKPKNNQVTQLTSYTPKGSSNVKNTKEIIKQAYSKVAEKGESCCSGGGCCGGGSDLSQDIGYTSEELRTLSDANLGLGCGHPISFAQLKAGDIVLDLGSGAGLDCFLAARKVGKTGKVFGVDMTESMIKKARENALKYNFSNVQFLLGDIEKLPLGNASVDVVISNCVINLAPDKEKVFAEAYRVLKPGGKMAISDVVLLGELTKEQKNDPKLLCACVSGALPKEQCLAMLAKAGFTQVVVIEEDKEIGTKWFGNSGLPIASLKYIAYKK